MIINSPVIQKIVEIQNKLNIDNNKLLIFSLSLSNGKISAIRTIKEELYINEEELSIFFKALDTIGLINKNDIDIIRKLNKGKNVKIDNKDFSKEAKEIISHLNNLTKVKRTVTDNRLKTISSWLKKGYTVDTFFKVNMFFFDSWGKDPNMAIYVRPETLYNGKFVSRVEEAENVFLLIDKFKKEIKDIERYYRNTYSQIIEQSTNDITHNINSENIYLSDMEVSKRLSFWLSKGFQDFQIKEVIYESINSWSKNIELIPKINLSKIVDNKFLDRVKIIRSKKAYSNNKKTNNNTTSTSNSNSGILKWLQDKQKG